jgi:hypothetical protein
MSCDDAVPAGVKGDAKAACRPALLPLSLIELPRAGHAAFQASENPEILPLASHGFTLQCTGAELHCGSRLAALAV